MSASHADYAMTALCLWREARGEGQTGMTAVACVLRNRTQKHSSSYYAEVVKPWQFSSITAKGDPQLGLYPQVSDTWWTAAQLVAGNVIDSNVQDITNGATLYWNPNGIQSTKTYQLPDGTMVKFPQDWNMSAVRWVATIGAHIFLREV